MEAEQQVKHPGEVSPEQVEQIVRERHARREAQSEADAPARTGGKLMKALEDNAEADAKITQDEARDALAYFMATKDDEDKRIEPITLRINVGSKAKPEWVRWTIGPVEDDEITRIRKESVKGTRAQRRRGDAETDEMLVARKIVTRGTLDPDPRELAQAMGLLDPVDAIQTFFRKYGKTGLITQLSGEILSISGWDDEDVQEVEAARG
jgi:hypothetical protein